MARFIGILQEIMPAHIYPRRVLLIYHISLLCVVTQHALAGSMSDYQKDEGLLASLKSGDQKTLEKMYSALQDDFCRFIVSTFKCDYQQARDIYPECMSILYLNIRRNRLAPPLRSSLKTYLFSIGRHIYHRRNLDKYNTHKMAYPAEMEVSQVSDMVDDAMLKKERARQLRELLHKLGDPCKSLLEKVYFEEISFVVLSEQQGTPEATLRKRKFDCLKKLRKLISTAKILGS